MYGRNVGLPTGCDSLRGHDELRAVRLKRVLEPELMDDEQQSVAYAKADFSTSNQFFVDSVVRDFHGHMHDVVDIGCGPGDVEVRLARAVPGVHITAVDGSAPMIALARDAVHSAGLDSRVTVVQGYIPGASLREHGYDAILSRISSITCRIHRCSGARSHAWGAPAGRSP